MEKKRKADRTGRPQLSVDIIFAAVIIALGAVLYFLENTVILGIAIPGYTGLILAFAGIFWIFYTLFSPK